MKKSIRALLALLLAMTLVLGLAACGGDGETPSSEDTESDTPSESNIPSESDAPSENEPSDTPAESLIDMSIPEGTELGSRIADFTFTTYDGKEMSLYETLKEKDMVLINIWATWCGPCRQEFPFMEAAYEANKDNVEIFALSCEPDDTDDVLADYVADMGMTFPVGADTPALNELFMVDAIPTSIAVDRFGVICFIEAGSQTSQDNFQRLFDAFTGDSYTESNILDGIPAPVCDVEPSSPEELTAALNAQGGSLTFENPAPQTDWPFKVTTDGDRSCAVSTNVELDSTASVVSFSVEAKDGDALVLDYKVSTEAGCDLLGIYVDDELVKVFGSVRDWSTYAVALTAGTHKVTLAYEKDMYTSDNDDLAYIDNIRVLSGDEAAAALAANPVFPVSDETALVPTNEGAKEIVFADVNGILAANFGDAKYYIIPGEEAVFNITLEEGMDPDSVCVYSDYDGSYVGVADILEDGAFTFVTGIDSAETTGYTYCDVYLAQGNNVMYVIYFADEENVNAFLTENLPEGETWTYADGTAPGTSDLPGSTVEIPAGYSEYTLTFVDQNGDPVPGVVANVCDDDTCTPMTSDEDGVVYFVYPSFAYHIQVIKVPDGYEYDTANVLYTETESSVLEFVLTKK